MNRRQLLTTCWKRLTAGAIFSVVFNPFEITRTMGSFYLSQRSFGSATPPTTSLANGHRQLVDGTYSMQYAWRDGTGRCWKVEFEIDHESYTTAADRSWGYLTAFAAARTNHHAQRVGESLDTATPACDLRFEPLPAAERFERAVGFVRGLEYAVDPDSKSTVEYHRTPEETLVDGRGDCKDLTEVQGESPVL